MGTATNRTDAELIRAGAEGAAFAELYRRHVSTIHTWLLRRADWLASDLTAETFAQAWLSRRRFRGQCDGSALPWLFGIARNVLRASAKQDGAETAARRALGLPLDLAAEDGYEQIESQFSPPAPLAEALAELPEHERRALELRVVEEMPFAVVAERLDIRPAAARLRVVPRVAPARHDGHVRRDRCGVAGDRHRTSRGGPRSRRHAGGCGSLRHGRCSHHPRRRAVGWEDRGLERRRPGRDQLRPRRRE
jgi:RNA polymerase sigma factor (sigma-70 family)